MKAQILVVDDSLTVRMDLSEAFAAAGFSVTAAATAAEARAALAATDFDLVVLDVLLGFADGVDLLREIRETPRTAATIVILLSSLAQVRARVRGLRTGADDYVGKPYEAPYLIARARQLLRARRAEPAAASILIIDDSATSREHLRQLLEGAGYAALAAVSGENGLRMAADVRPAAILVDGEMPGMDGLAVLRQLRMDAGLRHTPCLLLTAAEDAHAEVRALESGADAFVRKADGGEMVLARLAVLLRSAGAPPDLAAASLMGPKKILAIDDDEAFLARIMADLKREGYDVAPANSGEEALELLEAETVDCILLDLMMPGLGGIETCRRLKAGAATRHLPVILFTARGDSEAMMEALRAGADDVVPKSGAFELLRARLTAQIRRKFFEDEKDPLRRQRGL
jgi:DNA-binding response OmpR family regulator